MRSRPACLSAILFLAMFFVFNATATAQRARQAGNVSDPEGNPIVGAQVKIDHIQGGTKQDHIETRTDEKGNFVFFGITGGDWNLTVTADGYMPHAQRVHVSSFQRNPNLKIRLRKAQVIVDTGTREEAESVVTEADKLVEKGEYDKAIALYNEYREKNPELVKIHTLIGELYEKKDDYESAVAEYEKVLEVDPDDKNALFFAGRAYSQRLFDFEKAEKCFLRLAELNPEDPGIMYTLGELMLNKGDTGGAIEFYLNAVTLQPDHADAHMKLGYAYYGEENWEKAIEHFEKFIELAPERPEVQFVKPDIEICRQKLAEQ